MADSLYVVLFGRTDNPEPSQRRYFSSLKKAEAYLSGCINTSQWPGHWIQDADGVCVYRDYYICISPGKLPAVDAMDDLIQLGLY